MIEAFLICLFLLMIPVRVNAEPLNDLVPVSLADAVTIYEQTGAVFTYTFSVSVLMGPGGMFTGTADEHYTATSDGTYLAIHCFRDDWWSGTGVGNNIVAVRLDGVPDFPEGIWASLIVDYSLGYNGIAESRFNALGADTQIGPYADKLCTYMGDQHSDLVLGFQTPTPPPTPDFSLSISPTSQTIAPEQSTTYAVTVTSIAGFSSEVTLGSSISPSSDGISLAFDSSSVMPPPDGSTELTLIVSTTRTVKTAFYAITVTGTSADKIRSATGMLTLAWYELFFEIDYMQGHAPTDAALNYIQDYYRNENISVTFYVDDAVPEDPLITEEEFWAIENVYNDPYNGMGDDWAAGDKRTGVYFSKWKWILYGTYFHVEGSGGTMKSVSGFCRVPGCYDEDGMHPSLSTFGGNYILVADAYNDAGETTEEMRTRKETAVFMHEMGHSIGILKLSRDLTRYFKGEWPWVERYDTRDLTSVMAELRLQVYDTTHQIHYSPNYWDLRDMEDYEV